MTVTHTIQINSPDFIQQNTAFTDLVYSFNYPAILNPSKAYEISFTYRSNTMVITPTATILVAINFGGSMNNYSVQNTGTATNASMILGFLVDKYAVNAISGQGVYIADKTTNSKVYMGAPPRDTNFQVRLQTGTGVLTTAITVPWNMCLTFTECEKQTY